MIPAQNWLLNRQQRISPVPLFSLPTSNLFIKTSAELCPCLRLKRTAMLLADCRGWISSFEGLLPDSFAQMLVWRPAVTVQLRLYSLEWASGLPESLAGGGCCLAASPEPLLFLLPRNAAGMWRLWILPVAPLGSLSVINICSGTCSRAIGMESCNHLEQQHIMLSTESRHLVIGWRIEDLSSGLAYNTVSTVILIPQMLSHQDRQASHHKD